MHDHMEKDSVLLKEEELNQTRFKILAVVLLLFLTVPRLLAFVFGYGAVVGVLGAPKVLSDASRTLYSKIVFCIDAIALCLLTSGFGQNRVNLAIIGLTICVVTCCTDLIFVKHVTKAGSFLSYFSLAITAFILFMVASGNTSIGN